MLAHNLGGDALGDLAEASTIQQQAELGMGMHVYEPRRDNLADSIYDAFGLHRRAADIDDPVACTRHIGLEPRAAGAVHDATILDQDIHLCRRWALCVDGCRTGQKETRQGRASENFLLRFRHVPHSRLACGASLLRKNSRGNLVFSCCTAVQCDIIDQKFPHVL